MKSALMTWSREGALLPWQPNASERETKQKRTALRHCIKTKFSGQTNTVSHPDRDRQTDRHTRMWTQPKWVFRKLKTISDSTNALTTLQAYPRHSRQGWKSSWGNLQSAVTVLSCWGGQENNKAVWGEDFTTHPCISLMFLGNTWLVSRCWPVFPDADVWQRQRYRRAFSKHL